jgi:hypothetical protein
LVYMSQGKARHRSGDRRHHLEVQT